MRIRSYLNAVLRLVNNKLLLLLLLLLFNEYLWERSAKRSAISVQDRSQEEKCGFIYAWAEYYLQPNKVGRRCARADHYLYAFICMSRGGLSAYEKEEKFASNDNGCCLSVVANVTETCLWHVFTPCTFSYRMTGNDNVLQVLRAIRLISVTQSVYFGFLSNRVEQFKYRSEARSLCRFTVYC